MVSHETSTFLEARELWKSFDGKRVLEGISLRVERGEIVALLGPSGSGKSTLLRCVAGLTSLDSGAVMLRGRDITTTPAHLRGFGMMFQHFALFPHLDVAANIAFGLRMQGTPPTARERRVAEMLELVGLQGFERRAIFDLSGGERQRVALARSLAPSPQLLLLDEPLAALDRSLRERLMDELRQILKELAVTAIYVTHDQQEAFALSDRIVLIHRGRTVQEGPPEALYRSPNSRFTASFFGLRNQIAIDGLRQTAPGAWEARTIVGALSFASAAPPSRTLLIRPEAATLATGSESNLIDGKICERSFRGTHYRLVTRHTEGVELEWELSTPELDLPRVGERIRLALRPDAITFLN